ncbi:[protein-PII] uridylyltransferase [Rosistilla oblonga]|uniref:[protein-PII] uridylyltransferase n=1 Tax=Rosistilla oblonga TaxID=2527990 RepID=UPI003A96DF9A
MVGSTPVREVVQRSKQYLLVEREKLRIQHDSGSPGPQVSAALSQLADEIVVDIYQQCLRDAKLEHLADQMVLIAHGSYGRGVLAPFSDIDLMLLHAPSVEKQINPLISQLSRDIVDVGYVLGFSARTASEAYAWAWKEIPVFTSLCESRWLDGSRDLFERFFHSFRLRAMRRKNRLTNGIIAARLEEREKWGESSYLLRPNVKRSRGTLRDVQMIRWLGFANAGETDIEKLVDLGVFNEDDYRHVKRGNSFLLRLRNELHFMSGKQSQDLLDRHLQIEIADRWGYRGETGMLPVEEFMRDYFEHTGEVRYAVSHFRDTCRNRSVFGAAIDRAFSKTVDEDFKVGPYHIWIKPRSLDRVANSVADVLHLMDIANQRCLRIRHQSWQAIRTAMRVRQPESPTPETTQHFLSLISQPGRLADLLRRLNELRVLEQIIPGMKHARRLLQFNQYHKYTVDAHSIRAVEAATHFIDNEDWPGQIYRAMKDKTRLHLSLLIHDLGKGFEEDHSDVGKRIAEETADLLHMSEDDRELLGWMVHKHLLMAHTAFRHNLNDPDMLTMFASEVGTPQRLDMLVLHTIADLTAVGPDVLTDWKLSLLRELYENTKRYFRTGELPDDPDISVLETKNQLLTALEKANASRVSFECVKSMPSSMLRHHDADELLEELMLADKLTNTDRVAVVIPRSIPDSHALEYTVIIRQDDRPIGTFSRITGALSGMGLEILRADIETVGDNLAWDRFLVNDPDAVETSLARRNAVCKAIVDYLAADEIPQPTFRRRWNRAAVKQVAEVQQLPTRVTFDNETSERSTIISLFAYDRPGLLFTIAKALANLGVVLNFAKISTHLDQVVDVFYVTELNGDKLDSPQRRQILREHLLDSVQRLEQ